MTGPCVIATEIFDIYNDAIACDDRPGAEQALDAYYDHRDVCPRCRQRVTGEVW